MPPDYPSRCATASRQAAKLTVPRDQRSAVITRPIAQPVCASLTLLGTQRLRHLCFEHLLEGRSNQHPQELLVLR